MSREYPCVYYDDQKCRRAPEDGVTEWCVLGPCSYETPSKADRIRAMSDEELAEWVSDRTVDSLCEIVCGGVCTAFDTLDKTSDQFCKEIVLKWLQQPADLGMEGCLRERAAEGSDPYGEAGQRGRKRKCGECQYGKKCYFPRGNYVVLCKKLSTDDEPVYRTPADECRAQMKEDDNAD